MNPSGDGVPGTKSLDSTLAFLSEGYRFISNRCRELGSDAFETRLALRKVVCMQGAEAARVFYAPDRFTRRRSMPPTTLWLLQDRGSVQQLDGEEHRHRKKMFLHLLGPDRVPNLAETVRREWLDSLSRWEDEEEVVLHDAARGVLCRAVCAWTGVPVSTRETERRRRELGAMIDGAGSAGPRNWWAQLLRVRTERWARDLVRRVRSRGSRGEGTSPGSVLEAIALHRDRDGERLSVETAAVELINILRPTVAIARFVTFAALALHRHPESRERIAAGDDRHLERFAHEVRRYYPFFPLIGGRVREEFRWRGYRFEPGRWVILDLYGTNHDPRAWADPDDFRPDRFRGRTPTAHDLVPQGGGDHGSGHRCAGEWATVEILETAVRLLAVEMRYRVPEQDLEIDLTQMPALPESGFVMRDVRRRGGRPPPPGAPPTDSRSGPT